MSSVSGDFIREPRPRAGFAPGPHCEPTAAPRPLTAFAVLNSFRRLGFTGVKLTVPKSIFYTQKDITPPLLMQSKMVPSPSSKAPAATLKARMPTRLTRAVRGIPAEFLMVLHAEAGYSIVKKISTGIFIRERIYHIIWCLQPSWVVECVRVAALRQVN